MKTALVALCALIFASAAHAQVIAPATVSDADIAGLIRFRVDKQHRASAVVVGVLRPSGASIVAYGPASGNRKVGGDSIFEIASLTKIFTDLLLADAAVRGEAGMDEPLSNLVPPGTKVPSFQGQPITLEDLATHGSGLPLRPNNLHAAPDAPNKYAGYTVDQLYAGLPDYRLTRPPAAKFEYSNLGVALLGQGLAFRAHTTYADLLASRITGPLGMKDTRLGIDPATHGRLVQGHDTDLRRVGPTDDGALNPAGGLRSTANDLLKFLALFAKTEGHGSLARAARLMLTVDRPGDDASTRMALGWRRSGSGAQTVYWSNGSGDGSRTFMGFNPASHTAVVALADAASGGGLDDIARHVLDPAQTVNFAIPPTYHEIHLPDAALDRLLGTYEYAKDDRFTITRGLTGLLVGTGPSQLVIYPASPTRFFAKVADLRFDFLGPAQGPPTALVLRQDGQNFTYRRVP